MDPSVSSSGAHKEHFFTARNPQEKTWKIEADGIWCFEEREETMEQYRGAQKKGGVSRSIRRAPLREKDALERKIQETEKDSG